MCTIVAKYLEDYGWVGVKNRDRNYKPTISISQNNRDGTEAVFIVDSVTRYSEGINAYGVGILNAATSVKNDESVAAIARKYEKEKLKKEGGYKAPDGIIIRNALRYKTPKEAADYLGTSKFMVRLFVESKFIDKLANGKYSRNNLNEFMNTDRYKSIVGSND